MLHLFRAWLMAVLLCVGGSVGAAVPSLIQYQGKVTVSGVPFTGSGQFKFAFVDEGVVTSRQASGTAQLSGGSVSGVVLAEAGAGYSAVPAVYFVGGGGSGAAAVATVSGGVVTSVIVTNGGAGYTSAPTVVIASPPQAVAYTTYWSNDGSSTAGSEPAVAVALNVTNGLYAVALGDTALPNMAAIPPTVFNNGSLYLRVWFSDGVHGFEKLNPDSRLTAAGYALIAKTVEDGAITSAKLATGAVTSTQLADGAITAGKVSAGAITGAALADGTVTASKLAGGSVTSDKLAVGAITADKVSGLLTDGGGGGPRGFSLVGPSAVSAFAQFVLVFDAPVSAVKNPDFGAGTALAADGSRAFLLAGGDTGIVERVYIYDALADAWSDGPALPVARRGAAAVVGNGKIFVIGGERADTPGALVAEVAVYDIASNQWTAKAAMPTPRRFLSAAWVNGVVYAVGGETTAGKSSCMETYTVATDQWAVGPAVPYAASHQGAIVFEGRVGVAGGMSPSGVLKAGASYSPATNQWKSIDGGPSTARQRPQLLAVERPGDPLHGVYIVGGITAEGELSNEVQYYKPDVAAYLRSLNTMNYPVYSGAVNKYRPFLWGGVLAKVTPWSYGPYLQPMDGTAAYWRTSLNAGVPKDLSATTRVVLLRLPTPPVPPALWYLHSSRYVDETHPWILAVSPQVTRYEGVSLPVGMSVNPVTGQINVTAETPTGVHKIGLLAIGPGGVSAVDLDVQVRIRSLVAWGQIVKNTATPTGQTDVVSASCSNINGAIVRSDGTTLFWGVTMSYPPKITGAKEINLADAVVALKQDGTVSMYGGDVWNGHYNNKPAEISGVVDIASGWAHTLALKQDGTLIAWGNNTAGQAIVPSGLGSIAVIAAGGNYSMVLKTDGTVVAWGDNSQGQCNVPAGLSGVKAISCGGQFAMALKTDGTVVAWGSNIDGQCNVPAGLSNVTAIAAGASHAVALKADGTVVAWGRNDYGQCNVPAGLFGVVAIYAGGNSVLAMAPRTGP